MPGVVAWLIYMYMQNRSRLNTRNSVVLFYFGENWLNIPWFVMCFLITSSIYLCFEKKMRQRSKFLRYCFFCRLKFSQLKSTTSLIQTRYLLCHTQHFNDMDAFCFSGMLQKTLSMKFLFEFIRSSLKKKLDFCIHT